MNACKDAEHGEVLLEFRLDISLDKVPGCGTARRSSSHRQRRKHRGPSASADFDLNKENRMLDWQCHSGASQQPTKAKRKLYCGKQALLMCLLLAEQLSTLINWK